ncbi:MAG: hypothetical protein IKX94_05035 [Muribaculaceae bacterium]|nr:hypothetical protein [Muribaculaceae bacterium]
MRLLPTFIIGITLTAIGCGGGAVETAKNDSSVTANQKEEVLEVARRQASRFVEIAGEDLPATDVLLDVRSKETQLRQSGHGEIADDYVNAFTAEVRRLNPTLADTTFVEKK